MQSARRWQAQRRQKSVNDFVSGQASMRKATARVELAEVKEARLAAGEMLLSALRFSQYGPNKGRSVG